jgi:hypothetical protein
MNFEEIRQGLFELNALHDVLRSADKFREGIRTGETPSPRMSIRILHWINPEHVTWDDLRQAKEDLEKRIEKETGFGIAYYEWVEGEIGSHVLIPKKER